MVMYAYRDVAGLPMAPRRHAVNASDTPAPSARAAGTRSVRGIGRRVSCHTNHASAASTMTTPSARRRTRSPSASVKPSQR